MNDKLLRDNLIELLKGGHAHVNLVKSVDNLKPENRSKRPAKDLHSVWELLEHIRISQEDILRYTLDPKWKSPSWPEEYWPDENENVPDKKWNDSVKKFNSDLNELIELAKNNSIDITSEIPHGEGRTYLRELMLAADHNSYHVAQIVLARKLLGDW